MLIIFFYFFPSLIVTSFFYEIIINQGLDVHSKWHHKEKRQCKPPRRSKQNAIFKLDHMSLLICLPPKCGTTNYQKALAPLIDGFDIKTRTASKVAEDFHVRKQKYI